MKNFLQKRKEEISRKDLRRGSLKRNKIRARKKSEIRGMKSLKGVPPPKKEENNDQIVGKGEGE